MEFFDCFGFVGENFVADKLKRVAWFGNWICDLTHQFDKISSINIHFECDFWQGAINLWKLLGGGCWQHGVWSVVHSTLGTWQKLTTSTSRIYGIWSGHSCVFETRRVCEFRFKLKTQLASFHVMLSFTVFKFLFF